MSKTRRPYPVTELLEAVRLEIVAEQRSDGGDAPKVSLSNGRLVASVAGRHEYLFTCAKWDESLDGSPVLVRASTSRGRWTQAEASRLPDGKVRLITEIDLGQSIRNMRLRRDDSARLAIVAERLESAADGDDAIRLQSSGWIVGRGEPRIGYEDNPGRWVANWATLRLNARQRIAVRQSLASEVLFLWGPPGTGKTDVVGHIVEGNVRQGHNVLFLAPTRVAVDQALERICDLLVDETGFSQGMVQRAGDIEVESLRDRYGPAIDTEQIVARVAAELDEAIIRSTDALRKAQEQIGLYKQAAELESCLANAREAQADADSARIEADNALSKARADAHHLQQRLVRAEEPKGLFAQRRAARINALRIEHADVEGRKQQAARQRQAAETVASRAASDVAEATRRLNELTSKLETLEPFATLGQRSGELRGQLDELNQQRARIRHTVRGRCRVLGTTVARAVQSRALLERVDVVVIDEAGMVDLPSAWLAAGLAQKRVVIAGDFRQLPAVTKADNDRQAGEDDRKHSRLWGSRDPFRAAGLVTESGTLRSDARLVSLDTQYRMREPICNLVNAVAYPDAPLKTGRGDGSRIPANPLVDTPLILVDTSRQRIPGPDKRANTVNEAVVHELVRGLQYEDVLPGRKWQASEIARGHHATDRLAVIAPYRAQVRALQTSLKYRFGNEYEGLVDTIHRFQGSQRPIIIFDTAAGAGKDPGYFYTSTGLASNTCRLLNVALSRAQDHLVVVADLDHLRQHLPQGSEARIMIDHLEAHAQVISADQLVPIREAAQLSELSEEELRRPAFFPADEVTNAVRWDIARSSTNIELYCPFLDPGPVKKWSTVLTERVRAGVRVVIYTRTIDEQRDAVGADRHRKRIEELRSAGCEVEFRERMHEKVLIIDGTVLWHGSLNLLANTGPTDLMMRFTDPASCARVSRVIERARKERAARNIFRESSTPPTSRTRPNGNSTPENDNIAAGHVIDGRLYLAVPIAEKEEAKRLLGARWDSENRLWYVDAARITPAQASRWLPSGRDFG